MAHSSCFAGIDALDVSRLSSVLRIAGVPEIVQPLALDVPALGRLHPDLLVCDIDHALVDPLELLRRVRFVLPECLIVVYTGDVRRSWGLACHLAGANCLLSKGSSEGELAGGVRSALDSGCFTDKLFVN